MKELRDLYDINSNKTNLTYYKGDNIPKGYYPMVVMIAIENMNDLYKGEDGYICRVEDKDDNLRDFIRDLLKEDKK